MKKLTIWSTFVLIFLYAGCSIFGGSNGIRKAKGYSLQAPKNWKRHDRAGTDHAYRLASGHYVTVTSSCQRHSKIALELLTKQALIGSRNVQIKSQKRRMVGSLIGLHTSARASADGQPYFIELFVLSKDGCVFDFSLLGARAPSVSQINSFIGFVKTFRYGKN